MRSTLIPIAAISLFDLASNYTNRSNSVCFFAFRLQSFSPRFVATRSFLGRRVMHPRRAIIGQVAPNLDTPTLMPLTTVLQFGGNDLILWLLRFGDSKVNMQFVRYGEELWILWWLVSCWVTVGTTWPDSRRWSVDRWHHTLSETRQLQEIEVKLTGVRHNARRS